MSESGRQDTAQTLFALVQRASKRGTEEALEGMLPELADEVVATQARRRVDLVARSRLEHALERYPAQDAAAWLEAKFDVAGGASALRSNLARWRTGQVRQVRRATLEQTIHDLGGTPSELPEPDELSEEVER